VFKIFVMLQIKFKNLYFDASLDGYKAVLGGFFLKYDLSGHSAYFVCVS